MPRRARKYLQSNYCHIIVQGINKEYIFQDDKSKEVYKAILKKKILKTEIKVIAYCIMGNHVHLLVYGKEQKDISKLMQKTNTSFAKYYNGTKKRLGYVFRDRYYAQDILDREQLLNCIVYIHNNPVKANMIKNEYDYLYSSYREYIDNKDLITQEAIKLVFEEDNYKEKFEAIHKRNKIENITDVTDEIKESNEIIRDYLDRYKKNMEQVIDDNKMFCELLLELRHYGGLSLREMSKILNINKDRLNKIINSNLR